MSQNDIIKNNLEYISNEISEIFKNNLFKNFSKIKISLSNLEYNLSEFLTTKKNSSDFQNTILTTLKKINYILQNEKVQNNFKNSNEKNYLKKTEKKKK